MAKNNLSLHFCLWACALVFGLALPAQSRAQVPVADTSKPLVVKTGKSRPAKFLGQVLSSNAQSIQVRSAQNTTVVRVFTYAPNVSAQMTRVLAQGGYHYGDKVVIDYAPGSDVALRIKGKPSKHG
jgi:hypothetical protein